MLGTGTRGTVMFTVGSSAFFRHHRFALSEVACNCSHYRTQSSRETILFTFHLQAGFEKLFEHFRPQAQPKRQ